jgi:hypothetical protein
MKSTARISSFTEQPNTRLTVTHSRSITTRNTVTRIVIDDFELGVILSRICEARPPLVEHLFSPAAQMKGAAASHASGTAAADSYNRG